MKTFGLVDKIKEELKDNNGKLSFNFIQELAESSKTTHIKPTENTRICVLTLPTGHEVVGVAQVLDKKNDVEEIGQKVAYDRTVDEIWRVAGNIAKLIQSGEI